MILSKFQFHGLREEQFLKYRSSTFQKTADGTRIFGTSHTLLHMIVSSDGLYNFLYVEIASKYVGEQLWMRHSAQMILNLQESFRGIPYEISRHLFETYSLF